MKSIKFIVVLLFSLFSFNMCVLAEASKFEPFITMDTDITENQIKVALGFSGEEIMTVKETLAYDSNKLTLIEVQALDNFNVATSVEKEDGKYRTIEILADSDYSFKESNYAVLVFEVKGSFKKKNKSDIYLYDYTASGPDKIKYRYKGLIASLNRVSLSEMNFVLSDITDSTKTKYWLLNHIYIFVIIGMVIIGGCLVIFILPSKRKKEIREKTTEDLLKPENYNPNTNNIKIDKDAIEAIGKIETKVDMTQAIIVDENVKPFGDIVGKFDDQEPKKDITFEQNNINVFDSNQKESLSNNSVQNANECLNDNVPNNNNGLQDNSGTTVNGFDPFHATIEQVSSETPNELEPTPKTEELKEAIQVPQSSEELTVINPQSFETVELPKLADDVNIGVQSAKTDEINNQNTADDNKIDILTILFMLIFVSSLILTNVRAEESNYRIKDLRDCIVGKTSYDKSLDYNNDGTIDVLDIIETKDLANCSFENLLSNDPGFAELHSQSNNLVSSDSNFVTPTKKGGILTNKEKTTKKTTTKKSSGTSQSSGGSKTTTQKTTKEATVRTTTQTPVKDSYTVNINATNGSSSPSSFELQAGKSKTISISGNSGYIINESASSCSNVAYSFNGINKLVLANITGPATCNLVFAPSGNIKVTLKYSIGKGNSSTITPSYTYSTKSIDNGGNGVYNQVWQTGLATPTGYKLAEGPSCGSYNNGVFSITIPSEPKTCTLTFNPILYNLKVFLSGQSSQINSGTLAKVFYNERKKITFESFTLYSKVSCPSGESSNLSRSGKEPYSYSFYYTHTSTSDATCNIS